MNSINIYGRLGSLWVTPSKLAETYTLQHFGKVYMAKQCEDEKVIKFEHLVIKKCWKCCEFALKIAILEYAADFHISERVSRVIIDNIDYPGRAQNRIKK